MPPGNENSCRHCGKVLRSREMSFVNGVKLPLCAECAGIYHTRCDHCGKFFDERYIYHLNGMNVCFSCREHHFFKCRRCTGFFPRNEVEMDGIYYLCRRCFEYEQYISSDDEIEKEEDIYDDESVYADEVDDPDADDDAENVFDVGKISSIVNNIAALAVLHKLSDSDEPKHRQRRRMSEWRDHCDCGSDCDSDCDCGF